jgi:molybdate transport system substrate-binding protein
VKQTWLALAVALAFASNAPAANAADKTVVVALVASTATAAMNEIVPLYERTHPGISVEPIYGGAQVLRAQVETGGAADVLLVGLSTIRALSSRLESPVGVFRYREAVLVPAGSTKVRDLRDLAKKGVHIAIGIAGSPHGTYARTVLERASLKYGKSFADDVLANVTATKTAAAQIPTAVTSGQVDAAIGFSSDASATITAIAIPAEFDVVTESFAAAIKNAPHAAAAHDFVTYLASPEALAIFRKHHFDGPS